VYFARQQAEFHAIARRIRRGESEGAMRQSDATRLRCSAFPKDRP
jgi:hypothetical protein